MSGKIYTPSKTTELSGDPNDVTNKYADVTGTTVGTKRGLDVAGLAEAIRWDDTSTANTIYVGYGAPGSITSSAVWRIMRVNTSTKAVTWADGIESYTQIWDNRTGLTYS